MTGVQTCALPICKKEGKNRPTAPCENDNIRENAITLAHTSVMATPRTNVDHIAKVKWCATLDLSTSIACGSRDGKTWTNDENYDPIDHWIPFSSPPLHLNCRCVLTYVLKSNKERGIDFPEFVMENCTRASIDGQVPSSVNYPDWLANQSAGRQDQVLGSERAQLWRCKKFTFEQMLDIHGQELPLTELKAKYDC